MNKSTIFTELLVCSFIRFGIRLHFIYFLRAIDCERVNRSNASTEEKNPYFPISGCCRNNMRAKNIKKAASRKEIERLYNALLICYFFGQHLKSNSFLVARTRLSKFTTEIKNV